MQSCPTEHRPLHSASRRQPWPGNEHIASTLSVLCAVQLETGGGNSCRVWICFPTLPPAPLSVQTRKEGTALLALRVRAQPGLSYPGAGGSRERLWGPQPLLCHRQISDLLLDGPLNCGVAAAQQLVRPGGWKSRGPCGAASMDKPNCEGQGDSAWKAAWRVRARCPGHAVPGWCFQMGGWIVSCFSGVMIFPLACPAPLSQGLFAQFSPLALPGNVPF